MSCAACHICIIPGDDCSTDISGPAGSVSAKPLLHTTAPPCCSFPSTSAAVLWNCIRPWIQGCTDEQSHVCLALRNSIRRNAERYIHADLLLLPLQHAQSRLWLRWWLGEWLRQLVLRPRRPAAALRPPRCRPVAIAASGTLCAPPEAGPRCQPTAQRHA